MKTFLGLIIIFSLIGIVVSAPNSIGEVNMAAPLFGLVLVCAIIAFALYYFIEAPIDTHYNSGHYGNYNDYYYSDYNTNPIQFNSTKTASSKKEELFHLADTMKRKLNEIEVIYETTRDNNDNNSGSNSGNNC